MKRRKWTPEKIAGVMREVEADIGRGVRIEDSLRKFGAAPSMYYRWKSKLAPVESDHQQRLKELERENARLRQVVSDQALDIAQLREVVRGKF